MSCPVAASLKELARPPSRPRASRTVTSKPRGASAVAAAKPARPPPMIRTVSAIPSRPTPADRQRLHRQRELAPGTQAHPAAENIVVPPFDQVEQAPVCSQHDQEDSATGRRQKASQRQSRVVELASPLDLEL